MSRSGDGLARVTELSTTTGPSTKIHFRAADA